MTDTMGAPRRTTVEARVQQLPSEDQVLVLGSMVESRSGTGRFAPTHVTALMDSIGLPRRHVSNALAALARAGRVSRAPGHGAVWRVSPVGHERLRAIATPADIAALRAAADHEPSSLLGGHRHPTIPPWLAPPDLLAPVSRFLEGHPFERNVLAMTRFPGPGGSDTLRAAIASARQTCEQLGFEMHLASDRSLVDDLWGNVSAHMWASALGVAFVEDVAGRGLNYNLTIELGAMIMTGRRCCLLKDRSAGDLPSDLVGHIYYSVDMDDQGSIDTALRSWLATP